MSAYFKFDKESPLVEVEDVKDAAELVSIFQELMTRNQAVPFNMGDGVIMVKNMGRIDGVVVYETPDHEPELIMQFNNWKFGA
ncbi:hypothetical protein VVR12_03175 [Rothia sp. LK2588]|uniref:hypothetical protein n=1 Tax=Rothia sp. LK2588 TaxID=3114369 RepID=UPI0034CF4502